jgi:hypothetical protein
MPPVNELWMRGIRMDQRFGITGLEARCPRQGSNKHFCDLSHCVPPQDQRLSRILTTATAASRKMPQSRPREILLTDTVKCLVPIPHGILGRRGLHGRRSGPDRRDVSGLGRRCTGQPAGSVRESLRLMQYCVHTSAKWHTFRPAFTAWRQFLE